MRPTVSAVILLCLLGSVSFAQTARHPFSYEDLVALHDAAAVAVSPDGKIVLYRVTSGAAKGKDNVEWHLIPVAGGTSRQLSLPENYMPKGFTADGKALYGLLEVNKRMQLATLPLAEPNTPAAAAATPVPLTGLPRGSQSALHLTRWPPLSPSSPTRACLTPGRRAHGDRELHRPAFTLSMRMVGRRMVVSHIEGCRRRRDRLVAGRHLHRRTFADARRSAFTTFIPTSMCAQRRTTRHIATLDNAGSNIGWIDGGKEIVFLSTTTQVLTPDHVWTVPAAGGTPQDRTPNLPASAIHLYVDPKGNAWVMSRAACRRDRQFQQQRARNHIQMAERDDRYGVVTPQIASAPDIRVLTVADPQHAQMWPS